MKRIFVGGTGRSGTTIIQHALSFSPDIYAVPIETKFIVEVDGLADLVENMTSSFSPLSVENIERFMHLMRNILPGKVTSNYLTDTYRIGEYLLPSLYANYYSVVDKFLMYIEANWKTDRVTFLNMSRSLIDGLFSSEAERRGLNVWAEKTPANLLRLGFLREIYPDSYFIHVLRDPRDVLESYTARGWLSQDPLLAVRRLKFMYGSWLSSIAYARKQQHFIEIRLEDLISNPAMTLSSLATRLGVVEHSEAGINCVEEAMRAYYGCRIGTAILSRRRQEARKPLYEMLHPECVFLGYA